MATRSLLSGKISSTEQERRSRRSPDDSGDQRDPFQIDRDRLLYSSAFRRLAGVTQVVHVAEGHVFHNRLTHSLKVAQIGRRLAEQVLRADEKARAAHLVNPDVVETASLAHDLGHPPFGHIAEEELDSLLRQLDIADGFEGNAQSFRIVTKVAIRSEGEGLNLSRGSLNAILKYPWARGVDGKEHRKWGYYYSEKDDFDFARKSLPAGHRGQCIEAALMDWADDVAYSVHDVEDFFKAGLVPLNTLLFRGPDRERFLDYVENERKRRATDVHKFSKKQAGDFFDRLASAVLLADSDQQLSEPFRGTKKQRAALSFLASTLIQRYIVGDQEPAVSIRHEDVPSLAIHPTLRAEVDLLKELMGCYVFHNSALLGQQYGQRKVIRDLFQILFESTAAGSKHRDLVPPPYSETLNAGSSPRERGRVVSDLVASLTEQQALTLHQRLTGAAPGSIRDLIVR